MSQIEDPRLRTYVIWGPMLDKETEDDASIATRHVADARTTHYWMADHALAEAFQDPLGLELEAAWDTFLLFDPGVRWEDAAPTPGYFMHVGRRLPDDQRLNGDKLRAAIMKLLATEGTTAASK